jgi:8-oxo-dGTP pyrophosphatase MutT (NUDIX family)
MAGREDVTCISNEACFQRLRALLGLEPREKDHHKCLQRASALVLLFSSPSISPSNKNGDNHHQTLYTLITKRSTNLRSHPGECCFPGGRQDKDDDNDDVRTALREAQEEIGLDLRHVEILGRLPFTVESVNHLCVTSIVAKVKEDDDSIMHWKHDFMRDYPWKINQQEVDSAFAVPLAFFLQDPTNIFEVEWSGESFLMRKYDYHDVGTSNRTFSITGLTAHIAHAVASAAYFDQQSHSKYDTTETKRNNYTMQAISGNSTTTSGYLWKQELSSNGRAYWTRRYFVCADANNNTATTPSSSCFLHQFDNEQQASRKMQAATKKNRFPLRDCAVSSLESSSTLTTTSPIHSSDAVLAVDGEPVVTSKYEFVLSALDGRLQWHLAAPTAMDRECWICTLAASNSGRILDAAVPY